MVATSSRDREPNGRWLLRTCPEDFEQVFVRIGRLACEEHYRAGQDPVTRWLEECGKDRLIAARAEHVRNHRRRNVSSFSTKRASVERKQTVSVTLARHAAAHLRKVRNGGWIISPAGDGDWWVGSRKRTAAELVILACRKGFIATLSDEFGSD